MASGGCGLRPLHLGSTSIIIWTPSQKILPAVYYSVVQNSGKGKFGKTNIIRQYLPRQIPDLLK